eukprot:scaffold21168_cov35-Tisochrysis_lutea.AAC.3
MKLSIILGVAQMLLGLGISLANALHSRNELDVWCDFVPQARITPIVRIRHVRRLSSCCPFLATSSSASSTSGRSIGWARLSPLPR